MNKVELMRMDLMVKSFRKMESADRAWVIAKFIHEDLELRFPKPQDFRRIKRKLKNKKHKSTVRGKR